MPYNLTTTHPSIPSLAKRGEAPGKSLIKKGLLRGVSSGREVRLMIHCHPELVSGSIWLLI